MASRRLGAQGLTDPDSPDALAVTDRLLAIQAQDPRGARLAVRARLGDSIQSPSSALVDAALNKGQLVVGWLNRGTLHLVRSEDYLWLHSVMAPRQATANRTRLRQEGVSEKQAERGVRLIEERLSEGPATRSELRDLLEDDGVPVAGQAMVHILYLASIRGLIVRGPMSGNEHAFVLVREWIGEPDAGDPGRHLPELARRYLAGHGPASDRDLAAWAGIPVGQARTGLNAISDELIEVDGLFDLERGDKTGKSESGEGPVRLLGSFDPILHGWASRDWIVPGASERGVVTTNGLFRPTILVRDEIVGIWSMPGGKVELKPFGALDGEISRILEEEARRVIDYLSL